MYIFDSFIMNVAFDHLSWLNEVVVGPDALEYLAFYVAL